MGKAQADQLKIDNEKGASIFLKLSQILPDVLFLIGGRTLGHYANSPLPKNVVYAGFLSREKLPVWYNAFDIYCFPKAFEPVGIETGTSYFFRPGIWTRGVDFSDSTDENQLAGIWDRY